MYHLWVWEAPSWRVLASYPTAREALAAGRHAADPPDTWLVAKDGSPEDTYLRAHCTERVANFVPRGGRRA